MWSQNNEELIIENHFKEFKGTFLDLGAYDGKDLSNTRLLMEKGWMGGCVEPNPDIFLRLAENVIEFDNIYCYELAMGVANGVMTMQANDSYYSTLKTADFDKWKATQSFKEVEVKVIDFKTFLKTSPIKKFDFISIDCEGLDYEILTQIDLDLVECKCICVEHNSVEPFKYMNYINIFDGFKLIGSNAENLIMAR